MSLSTLVTLPTAMKSGLKDTVSGLNNAGGMSYTPYRDEKRTESMEIVASSSISRKSYTPYRDEKRTESYLQSRGQMLTLVVTLPTAMKSGLKAKQFCLFLKISPVTLPTAMKSGLKG